MPIWIGRLSRAGLLACSISVAGCQDQASENVPPDPDVQSGPPTLAGEWRWAASERGDQVVRPTSPADSMTFSADASGVYRERTGGALLTGRYSLGEGRLFQIRDSSFTVLVLDSSRFFPPAGNGRPTIAVRSLRGDSLVLSGTVADSTFYTFVRVRPSP